MDYSGFKEKLASLASADIGDSRHLDILAWLTELSGKCCSSSPVLVGCGAVEVYTSSNTSPGDNDIVIEDIKPLTSSLLELGFKRSGDQRFYYFPGFAILFEFPSTRLREGEETITLNHNGIDCLIISPEDLIVNRLESFEASGGGLELYHAYLIYHLHYNFLDRERLRESVKSRDVRESFIFIRKLHLETDEYSLPVEKQAETIVKECRFRRGIE